MAEVEQVPGLLIRRRLFRMIQQSARQGGRVGRPERNSDGKHRLNSVVHIPARRLRCNNGLVVRIEATNPASRLRNEIVISEIKEGTVAVFKVLNLAGSDTIIQVGTT